jgi:hypothetical protein
MEIHMKTKISIVVIMLAVLYFCPHYVFGQNFSRVLELNARRINGPDVEALQKRLLYFGFAGVGGYALVTVTNIS